MRLGGRTGTIPLVEREAEAKEYMAFYGLDGVAGLQVITGLASRLHFEPPGTARLSGRPCPGTYEKVYVAGSVEGTPVSIFVDTGAFASHLFRQGLASDLLTLPDGTVVQADRLTEAQVQAQYGGGVMDGRRIDGVLGWRTLRTLEWTLDACTQGLTLGPDPGDSAED